jgi:hypothetical protein
MVSGDPNNRFEMRSVLPDTCRMPDLDNLIAIPLTSSALAAALVGDPEAALLRNPNVGVRALSSTVRRRGRLGSAIVRA